MEITLKKREEFTDQLFLLPSVRINSNLGVIEILIERKKLINLIGFKIKKKSVEDEIGDEKKTELYHIHET